MRVGKTFRKVTIVSAIVSSICFFVGLSVSFALDTPAGASIIVANAAAFIALAAVGKGYSLIPKKKADKKGATCYRRPNILLIMPFILRRLSLLWHSFFG